MNQDLDAKLLKNTKADECEICYKYFAALLHSKALDIGHCFRSQPVIPATKSAIYFAD